MRHVTDRMAEHLCALSQLGREEAGDPKLREDLEKILEYMDQLNEIDTTDVDEYGSEVIKDNVMRNDEIFEGCPELLKLAPQVKDHKIVVPRTF
ncbi:MAG: Asp-tRNA(Asn)/Glu-tRNA(Gln) amidotransferase subunit GatC [Lachnospiraceae bacterium]|nr:Asp-tRNA(Asn)/Glu-tRNA(Gln) amidotransferase subunit GatC [Lachnospiraceae bacterium]